LHRWVKAFCELRLYRILIGFHQPASCAHEW
jgi:hypothetical protein